MRKIGRKTVRQFSEKGWPTRGGFLYNMNTYLIHDPFSPGPCVIPWAFHEHFSFFEEV